jgi:hypothetical protein
LKYRYTPGCSGSRAICSLSSWMGIRYYVAFPVGV